MQQLIAQTQEKHCHVCADIRAGRKVLSIAYRAPTPVRQLLEKRGHAATLKAMAASRAMEPLQCKQRQAPLHMQAIRDNAVTSMLMKP